METLTLCFIIFQRQEPLGFHEKFENTRYIKVSTCKLKKKLFTSEKNVIQLHIIVSEKVNRECNFQIVNIQISLKNDILRALTKQSIIILTAHFSRLNELPICTNINITRLKQKFIRFRLYLSSAASFTNDVVNRKQIDVWE